MKAFFILITAIFLLSCSVGSNDSGSSGEPSNKDFYFVGPSSYPSIQALQPVQNYIFARNIGATETRIVESLSGSGVSVSYSSLDPLCSFPMIPAKRTCLFHAIYTPASAGVSAVSYSLNSNSISLQFNVVASPSIVVSNGVNINLGSIRAGTSFNHIIQLQNSGDISSGFFLADLPSFAVVTSTTCGYSLPPRGSCEVTVKLTPKTRAEDVNNQFSIRSEGQNITFGISGRVLAGDPYGEIFSDGAIPTSLRPSDGEVLVETKYITDEFGNIVEDGTPVYVFFSEVEVLDLPGGALQSNPYYIETQNGKVAFKMRAPASVSSTKLGEIRINSGISELFRVINVSP